MGHELKLDRCLHTTCQVQPASSTLKSSRVLAIWS